MCWHLEDSGHNSECLGLHLQQTGLQCKRNEQPLSLVRTSSVGNLSRPVLLRHYGIKSQINYQKIMLLLLIVFYRLAIHQHDKVNLLIFDLLKPISIPLGGAPHPSDSCSVPF